MFLKEALELMPPFVDVADEFCREAAVGFGRDRCHDLGLGKDVAPPGRIEGAVSADLAAGQTRHRPLNRQGRLYNQTATTCSTAPWVDGVSALPLRSPGDHRSASGPGRVFGKGGSMARSALDPGPNPALSLSCPGLFEAKPTARAKSRAAISGTVRAIFTDCFPDSRSDLWTSTAARV